MWEQWNVELCECGSRHTWASGLVCECVWISLACPSPLAAAIHIHWGLPFVSWMLMTHLLPSLTSSAFLPWTGLSCLEQVCKLWSGSNFSVYIVAYDNSCPQNYCLPLADPLTFWTLLDIITVTKGSLQFKTKISAHQFTQFFPLFSSSLVSTWGQASGVGTIQSLHPPPFFPPYMDTYSSLVHDSPKLDIT